MAEKKPPQKDDVAYRAVEETRPPLAFLADREALVRRFVLSELIGPPRARRTLRGAQRR